MPAGQLCTVYIHTSACSARVHEPERTRQQALCRTRLLPGFEAVLERELALVLTTGDVYREGMRSIPVGLYLHRSDE